jgi:aminomethyltransferase
MQLLTLHSIHQHLGARFGEINGFEAVQSYRSPADEYTAARSAASLFDLSFRDLLRLSGEDRVSFLQGMVTQEVKRLPDNHATYAAMLTAKGSMVCDAQILKRPKDLLLDLEPGCGARAKGFLETYLISEDAAVTEASAELGVLRLIGPRSAAALAKAADVALPDPGLMVGAQIANTSVLVVGLSMGQESGMDLLVPRDRLQLVFEQLIRAGEKEGLRAAGFDALEMLRVEAGVPRFLQDMDERTIPLEASLERAISYDKGCYIGQEIIARATYRGHVNRKLTGLLLGGELPPHRAELQVDGKKAGWITSAVRSPLMQQVIGLGYVQRELLAPGTVLQIPASAGRATVHALPFRS